MLSAGHILGSVWELARWALRLSWALLLPKALLASRLVAPESQLAVELSGSAGGRRRRRQFSTAFRMLWVVLGALEAVGRLGKPGASDEAGDGEALAHNSLPPLLALASGPPSAEV